MRVLLLLCLVAVALATPNPCNELKTCPHKDSAGRLKKSARPAGSFHVISTPLLRLGVFGAGNLNAYPTAFPSANTDPSENPVGLRYLGSGTENDATAPGCYCEGFGVSAVWTDSTSTVGVADQSTGFGGITYGVPTPVGATGADTLATVGTSPYSVDVRHEFRLSPVTNNAFQVRITLTNNHPTEGINRLRYVRQMDWDIYPTTFSECVDIDIGTAVDLPCAHSNGFIAGNPDTDFPSPGWDNLGSCGGPNPRSIFNSGPRDHGAAFLIQFADINSTHPLAPGQSKSFLMFYGAANTKAEARGVLGLLDVEAYSLGYPSSDGSHAQTCDPTINTGAPNTYLWAFNGLGGRIIVEDPSCLGVDCARTTACPTATSASASTTTANCATISFDGTAC